MILLYVVSFAVLITVVCSGPASSCESGSTDPCCSYQNVGGLLALGISIQKVSKTLNGQNSEVCRHQTELNAFGNYLVANRCFGGRIAQYPGDSSGGAFAQWYYNNLEFAQWEGYHELLGCPIQFKYNGSYTEWGEPTPCAPFQPTLCSPTSLTVAGTQTTTRNCTNPRPYNGGADCSSLGPATQSFPCQYLCPQAKASVSSTSSGSESSTGIIIGAVVGSLVFIVIIGVVVVLCIRRSRATDQRRSSVVTPHYPPTNAGLQPIAVMPPQYYHKHHDVVIDKQIPV